MDGRPGIDLAAGVWFREEVRERTIFPEQYDFAVTLLLLPDERGYAPLDVEPEEDVFDRLSSPRFSRS